MRGKVKAEVIGGVFQMRVENDRTAEPAILDLAPAPARTRTTPH